MRALYDYTDANEDENYLALTAGEIITNVTSTDADWAKGRNAEGKTGFFPLNYCEVFCCVQLGFFNWC